MFLEEVLETYSVLFGNDERSKKLYRRLERVRATEARGGLADPILDGLCGIGLESKDKELSRKHAITEADFPVLWQRLQHLQEYILKEEPWDVKTLWQDRRDLLRWYTLWAVIILGLVGIILALVQVALSAAQVAVAIQSLQYQRNTPPSQGS